MKVRIDKDICCKCEACVHYCPEVFGLINKKVEVILYKVPEELDTKLQKAYDECPGNLEDPAIIIEEAG